MGRLRAPMLGRDEELERLQAAAQRRPGGTSDRVLIVAPPGVGKTRLIEALAGELRRAAGTSSARRRDAGRSGIRGDRPAGPRGVRGRRRPDPPTPRRSTAGSRRPSRPAAPRSWRATSARCWSRPSRPLRATGPGRFASWAEAIAASSDGRPQAWLLEDLHWAGGDLLAFLDAAAALPGSRRLIVGTARPHLLDELRAGEGSGQTRTDRAGGWGVLHLPTLSPVACAAVLDALVGDAIPPELAARIVARSDGNCLFVEELLRSWASVGLLVHEGGAWRLTVEAAEVPLPQTVQAIYAAQLDDLPAVARAVVRRGRGRRAPVPRGSAGPARACRQAGDAIETLRRRALLSDPVPMDLVGTRLWVPPRAAARCGLREPRARRARGSPRPARPMARGGRRRARRGGRRRDRAPLRRRVRGCSGAGPAHRRPRARDGRRPRVPLAGGRSRPRPRAIRDRHRGGGLPSRDRPDAGRSTGSPSPGSATGSRRRSPTDDLDQAVEADLAAIEDATRGARGGGRAPATGAPRWTSSPGRRPARRAAATSRSASPRRSRSPTARWRSWATAPVRGPRRARPDPRPRGSRQRLRRPRRGGAGDRGPGRGRRATTRSSRSRRVAPRSRSRQRRDDEGAAWARPRRRGDGAGPARCRGGRDRQRRQRRLRHGPGRRVRSAGPGARPRACAMRSTTGWAGSARRARSCGSRPVTGTGRRRRGGPPSSSRSGGASTGSSSARWRR